MIVLNPPKPPAGYELVTTAPEKRAVEAALRMVGISFRCAETSDPVIWLRLLQHHDPETTFILDLPSPVAISVVPDADVTDDLRAAHTIVDGAQGVLDLVALLASLLGRK